MPFRGHSRNGIFEHTMNITEIILTSENEHGVSMFGSKLLVHCHIFDTHEGVSHGNTLVTFLHGIQGPLLAVMVSIGDLTPYPHILPITLEVLICAETQTRTERLTEARLT